MKKIFVIAIFLFVAHSCKKELSPKSTKIPKSTDTIEAIKPGIKKSKDSITLHQTREFNVSEINFQGWLKMNISDVEIIKKLGSNYDITFEEYSQVTGYYVQNWEYKGIGISLGMQSDTPESKKSVIEITITEPCKYKTEQNIGIGSTAAEVYSAYKNMINEEETTKESIVVGSIYDGIIFIIMNNKVYEIFVGAAAE